jgi:hypothetical protein
MKTITEIEYWFLSMKERENFTGIVKWHDNSISYIKNNLCHREDGPAYIGCYGTKAWYFEGLLHNLNGPARIFPDGREEYWVYGNPTTKEAIEFLRDMIKLKAI